MGCLMPSDLWVLRRNGIPWAVGPYLVLLARARSDPWGSWSITRYEDQDMIAGGV